MKSLKILGVCSLTFLIFISACGYQSNNSDSASDKKTEDSTITPSDKDSLGSDSSGNSTANNNSTGASDSTVEELINGTSRISYPVFTNIKNEQQVNQLISDYVNELDSLYNDGTTTLSANFQIMFQNEQYLSIYFLGDLKGAAYPRTFKSSLNIDLTEGSRHTLSQIVNLNDDFINIVSNAVQEYLTSTGADMDTTILSDIKDKLENADSTASDVQSYFTSDEVVIILAVPHAIGDYIEVSISFTSVENYII